MKKSSLFYLLLIAAVLTSCSSDQPKSEAETTVASVEMTTEATDYPELIGGDYLIDNQHSYLGFKIKYFGFSPVRGRFDEFSGTLFYNENNLASMSVSIYINVSSINTGNDRRDNDLRSGGTWFDGESYPDIAFVSRGVLPNTDGSFNLIGDITIRGITRSDTIKFSKPTKISKDWAANDQVDFSGRFVLDRQDYKVSGDDFWSSVMENGLTQLSDEVEIELDIHCRRADYVARYAASDNTDLRKVVLDKIKFDGIKDGLDLIDSLFNKQEVSRGMMSTIGYTLSAWGEYASAERVFNQKERLFGIDENIANQLGIINLLLNKPTKAGAQFNRSLEIDSVNSRATEYLRLMERLN